MNTSVNSEQFLNKKDNLRKPQKCVCTDETDGLLTLFFCKMQNIQIIVFARCKTYKNKSCLWQSEKVLQWHVETVLLDACETWRVSRQTPYNSRKHKDNM